MDRMLWTELKRMFEPDPEDEVWKYQHGSYTLMWKLYETCGVHQLFTKNDSFKDNLEDEEVFEESSQMLKKFLFKKLDDLEEKEVKIAEEIKSAGERLRLLR
ncbi:hypothetical protein Tco_1547202 [Tanacetum coccineum]